MPQMSPLSWMTMFTSFNMLLVMCLVKTWYINYMSFELKNKNLVKASQMEFMWKW